MLDVDRAALTRLIYRKLAHPEFRRGLTAKAPDGTHPVIVALRDDLMADLVDKVHCAGGAANVFVPALNGFVGLEMQVGPAADGFVPSSESSEDLAPECTVGLFVARLSMDREETPYRLRAAAGPSSGGQQDRPTRHGQARLVALGD